MPEKVFDPAPFFLLRTPTWSVDRLTQLCSPLEIYSANELLREAIAIASPAFYSSLKKSKNPNQESKSISNYISRMIMRSTPFGLFSTVSTGKWGDTERNCFDERSLQKRARFDMEWVYLLIQNLYQDEIKWLSLPLRTNPLLRLHGEKYHLNYVRQIVDKNLSPQSLSIRVTHLIQLILEHAKPGIPVEELWLKLHADLPLLEKDKTLEVIRHLLSQQFLLPGLLPSLLSDSPYDILSPYSHLFPGLDAILEELKNYKAAPIGKGEKVLERLHDKMAALVPHKSYLQVDTAYEGKTVEFSKNVQRELEKTVELLWKIACIKKSPNRLSTYHAKFLEKYGEYRRIPLLELLDEDKGLGASFENAANLTINQEWEKWLHQEWQECLFHKKKEWELTERDIDAFLSKEKIDPAEAPLSLDLICKVFADSAQNVDLGKFLLVLTDLTAQGGSVFGRFLDLLGSETQDKIAQFFASEERLENSVFVELSYLPSIIRGANVSIHPCLRKYRLDIESTESQKGSLALDDIYVGATSSNLYLTDRDGQLNIITRENHLLNDHYAPPPLKFMRYVTLFQYSSISLFSWGSLQEKAVFLPRVRFHKTILSLATWNIDSKPYIKESLEKNTIYFNKWADRWDLPHCFFMVDGDQQLLIDRSKASHVDDIICKLKNGESLKFVEKMEGAWIKGTEGNHYCEIGVPFVKNIKHARSVNPIKAAPYSSENDDDRHKFPGCDWLYLKLYMDEKKISEFLVGYFYNFIEGFCRDGTLEKWFTVRYRDPEPHLRLRIHSESFEGIAKVTQALEEHFKLWTHLGWIKDVTIAKYEREIERYGGPLLIEAAESVFHSDTLSVLLITHAVLTKQIHCDEVVLHTLSIVNFLRTFNLDSVQILSLLNRLTLDESELKGFRKYKSQLVTLINALLHEENSEIPEIKLMNTASHIRMEDIQNFCKKAELEEKSYLDSIIESLLHLHCNRLGCLGKEEIKAKLYARQALLTMSTFPLVPS